MRKSTLKLISFAVFICVLIFPSNHVTAQVPGVVKCYTDEMDSIRRATSSNVESKEQFENWMQQALEAAQANKIIGGVYQIPVVFHVIHNGEAVGSGTNVSYAAIQSQIDVLNEDFRRIFGTNGYNTNPLGADTQIEFCLAKRRPDGSAFAAGSDGVNRINRSTAGFTAPPYTTTYIDNTIKAYTYNNNVPAVVSTWARGWDPAKYMNIWLCNISGGILGYAQFPESPMGGMDAGTGTYCGAQAPGTDGVVFLYNSIGKSSVTGFAGPYNEGRTATHEIGHWLGLRHIWGDGGCTVDDFCNDTPEASAANFGCPTINSCTNAPDPGNDMVANYMDYTDDLCMNIFTQDQKARMRMCLESSPRRVSLINSDACVAPSPNDCSVIDITNPIGDNCPGAIAPVVVLKNRGSANLTSATISYKIDNGPITTFAYSGTLTPGSTANVTLPSFTAYNGNHTITAYSTLPNGAADPSPAYDTTQLGFAVSNGIMAPYVENFDGQVFPPDLRWVVENSTNDCWEWISGSAVSSTGTFNNNAMLFPGFQNSSGQTDNIITPIFTLPCNATAANIQFDVAYRRRNTTPANYERLYVEISENCGGTWNSTLIYDKTGTTLQVLTTTTTSYYQPVGTTDWRTETIDLMSYVTPGASKNVKFRIRAVAANGNNIWIDNFKFNATTTGEAKVLQGTTEILDGGGYVYGNVTTCVNTPKTFTVTNTGTSTLTLTGPIAITGTAFTVGTTFGSTSLTAGASTTFIINFLPTAAGSYQETLSFGTNDCDEGTYNFLLIGTATGAACASANFTASPSPACVGQTVTFTSTSTGATSYSWNFGTGATPATATTAGPHTVTYSSAGTKNVSLQINGTGPTSNQTVTVNANPATPAITPSGATTFCSGGAVTLSAPAGATSYLWSPGGATTQTLNVTTSGSYTVTVSNASGCTATSAATTVTVNAAPATPTITPSGATTFCSGGSVTLSAPASTSYLWSPGGATTQTLNVTASGSYTVTVSNASGCTATSAATTVTVNALPAVPAITPGGPTTFCNGGSVTLSAPASTSYLWSPGGATTQTLNVTASGSYTVTVSNAAGCTRTSAATTVTVNPTPVITLGTVTNPSACAGTNGSIQVTGSGTGNLSWSGTASGSMTSVTLPQTITGLGAGSYSIQFTSAAGCTSNTLSPTLTGPAAPATPTIIPSGATTFCSGGSVTLSAPAGATSYLWSPGGATTQTLNVTTSGSYTVTVSNASGCTATSAATTVTVNALPATPAITPGGATTFCSGGSVTLSAPAGATSYLWSPGGATTQTLNVTTSGSYTVTVSNASGCTATSAATTVTVNALPATPAITPSGATTFCTGGSVTLSAPAGATSYLWSPGGATTQTLNVTSSGSYTVTVSNASGCTATSAATTVTVNANPSTPAITPSGATTFCSGGSVDLSAPAGATSYLWSPGGATTQTLNVTSGGSYTVTVSNASGCAATSAATSVTVNQAPATPAITPSGATTFCSGGSVDLSAPAGATSYLWSPGGATTQTLNVTSGGSYTVTVSNASGCTATSAATMVTVNAMPSAPVITPSGPTTFCAGGSVNLTSSSSTGNAWSTTENTQTITVSTPGTITLSVTVNGCTSASTSQLITVNPLPTVSLGSFADMCDYNAAITLSGGSPAGGTYSGNGVSGSVFDPATAGLGTSTITYSFTDGNGCTNTATSSVLVDDCLGIREDGITLQLYPNPASGMISITGNTAIQSVEVYDKIGRLVKEQTVNSAMSVEVDLSQFATGVYTLRVRTDLGVSSESIVLQH